MKITILTMFPQMLNGLLESPVLKRALKQEIFDLDIVDIKEFADGSFRHIDDSPYGGTPGMIIRMEPLVSALESAKTKNSHTILLSPKGQVYNQKKARQLAKEEHIILVCGHYEGIDARFDSFVDETISLGDYILTGGEYGAANICDSIVRLLDGTLKDGVTENESHENGLLEYPQYTHPLDFRGQKVPEILLSGNTKLINEWKHQRSIETTKKWRPDMIRAFMETQVNKSEDSFKSFLSEKISLSDNITEYEDNSIPDMYDHNFFNCNEKLTESEINNCLQIRQEHNCNFIKFQGKEQLNNELKEKFSLEESCILTMALSDTDIRESWTLNKDIEIRDYHNFRNGRDFIDFELENYGSVYGEDFTVRKISRYLKACDKDKRLNFYGAYLNSKLVGSLYTFNDFDCVGIDGLVTAPEHRHKKVATTLLHHVCGLAPFAYLHADNDDTPKQMYFDLGFREISKYWEYFRRLENERS